MCPTVPNAEPSDPVRQLDHIRTKPVKAGLRSDSLGPDVMEIAWAALVNYYGTVKAAAITLECDASQLRREVLDGKLARVKKDPDAMTAIASAVMNEFGALRDPKAHARKIIRDIRQRCDELDQVMEQAS